MPPRHVQLKANGGSYLDANDVSVACQLFDRFTYLFGQQPFNTLEVQLKPCQLVLCNIYPGAASRASTDVARTRFEPANLF